MENKKTSPKLNDFNCNTDSEPEIKNNNINELYISMSRIMESLNSNVKILNSQIFAIKKEIKYLSVNIDLMKESNIEMAKNYENKYNQIIKEIIELKKKSSTSNNKNFDELISISQRNSSEIEIIKEEGNLSKGIKKQINDTRALLLRIINDNMNSIKKQVENITYIQSKYKSVDLNSLNNMVIANIMEIHKIKEENDQTNKKISEIIGVLNSEEH